MSLRKEIETDIYEMLDDLDPSGENTKRMKAFFGTMSDTAFYRYMERFYSSDNMNYTVAYLPYDNPVNMDFIHKLFKKYNVPLYEYVYEPYLNEDVDDPPRSVHKILVVDVPVKRLKQMVINKTHMAVNPTKIDARTGQVTGHDKVARTTTPELYSMIVQNQYHAAKEQYGPLGDNTKAAFEMIRIIQRDGEVELKDIPDDPTDKVALDTVGYYLYGAGLATNLLDETGYVLPITQKIREENKNAISRQNGGNT